MTAEALLAAGLVGVPFVGAIGVAALGRVGRATHAPAGLALATGTILVLLVALFVALVPRPLFWRIDWIEVAGIGIGLYVDNLSVLFAVLIAAVSFLSLLYSLTYIPHELEQAEMSGGAVAYYGYLLLFTGAMLGLVFAIDLIQLYLFWELTGLASFFLIGLHWSDPAARSGAVKALVITGAGGVAMLLGFVLLSSVTATFSLPATIERGELLNGSPLFGIVLVLLLAGAAAKSAQFPFHVWLPRAMVAPTPVSAFLHSASLVAAGVYLLARFQPIFAGAPLWHGMVIGVGLASMLVGGVLALRATELKELLAYSTVSQYGFIFALLGYATAGALAAALFSFLQHGFIKAGLFFVAGLATYATGRKDLGAAGRLWRKLPSAGLFAAVLALSLGGLPPLAGFWMKEVFLEATLATQSVALVALGVGASALTLLYMLRFLVGSFGIGSEASPPRLTRPSPLLAIAPGLLALVTVLFSVAPTLAGAALVEPAAEAVVGTSVHLDLALHLDLKLALSGLALLLGAVGFATFPRWTALVHAATRPEWSLDRLYGGLTSGLSQTGQAVLRLQNGALASYLRIVWLSLLALIAFSALALTPQPALPTLTSGGLAATRGLLDWALALLLGLVALGTVLTFTTQRHLHLIIALSAVGYLIAAVFALELAPDVALVQVHVETMVTVLFVLALVLIPRRVRDRLILPARQRLTAGMLAVAGLSGLGAAWLSWLAFEYRPVDPIAPWFNANAPALVHAEDVVAAVLVHFRALDTLGEITVFAIAAIGVLALVRLIRGEGG